MGQPVKFELNGAWINSNRGFNVGDVIVKELFSPRVGRFNGAYWLYDHEVYHFEIMEVQKAGYCCKYLEKKGEYQEFFWYFFDQLPNYGFAGKNSSAFVRYYPLAKITQSDGGREKDD